MHEPERACTRRGTRTPANPEQGERGAVRLPRHAGPAACGGVERNGIHDTSATLLSVYTGVKHLVLVGDDRVIPFARMPDRTVLLPETTLREHGRRT